MPFNIIDIFIDGTSGTIKLTNPVPQQNLKLIGYRVYFDTQEHANACDYIKVNFPCFRGNAFIGGTNTTNTEYEFGLTGLTLLVSDNKITCEFPDAYIPMTDAMDEVFEYSLSGIDLTGLENIHLIFGFDSGGIARS
jgi:hypothetical protein